MNQLKNEKGNVGIEVILIIGLVCVGMAFLYRMILEPVLHRQKIESTASYVLEVEPIKVTRVYPTRTGTSIYYYLEYVANSSYVEGRLNESYVTLTHVEGEPLTLNLTCSVAQPVCTIDAVVRAEVVGDMSLLNASSSIHTSSDSSEQMMLNSLMNSMR